LGGFWTKKRKDKVVSKAKKKRGAKVNLNWEKIKTPLKKNGP